MWGWSGGGIRDIAQAVSGADLTSHPISFLLDILSSNLALLLLKKKEEEEEETVLAGCSIHNASHRVINLTERLKHPI